MTDKLNWKTYLYVIVKVKVKIVNFVFTTGKCQNISTLEDDGKSVWIVMLYYTVLI